MEIAVIGSSLSGICAAHALAARGLKVTILDVGEQLDAPRQAIVQKLHDQASIQWPTDESDLIRKNESYGKGVLPKKMHFGSSYIYAEDRPFAKLATMTEGRVPYPTFAKGGFSNIWGSAALPVDGCDMADWPVTRSEMDPYFQKVMQFMPLCGGEGNLSNAFPTYREALGSLDVGPQGEALLADLDLAKVRLLQRQSIYGKARLAIHTQAADGGVLPCNGCGHCFTGCVRNSIFSTLPILDELVHSKKVEYRNGFFVESIDERDGKVYVRGTDTRLSKRSELSFDSVFVGAGPINTTRLLLHSRKIYDQSVLLKESQKFVIPMLRLRSAETAIDHPAITLASVFFETKVPSLSDHWMHVQIIPMNEMIVEAGGLYGTKHPLGKHLWNPLLRRMMMGWCGMHSDHSSHVELRLRQGSDDTDTLELNLRISDQARIAARRAAKDLFHKGLLFNTLFCHKVIKFSNPGSGTHCGSSFPMKARPTEPFDTDKLGRPFGWSNVFVVDSSVLPSIPGTTLAFTVMSNAYRIATTAPIQPR